MTMLMGFFFILFGVIFFFAGGGGSVIMAIIKGRFSSTPLMPQIVFAAVGFGIWLLGAVMMLAGWIRARRKANR
ncbi:MAG TPA: hypothetical protein VF451_05955 [Acidobacteriota bacterium]